METVKYYAAFILGGTLLTVLILNANNPTVHSEQPIVYTPQTDLPSGPMQYATPLPSPDLHIPTFGVKYVFQFDGKDNMVVTETRN